MGARVLLVEQDETLRTAIVRAFRARGIGVDSFASADDALKAVELGAQWGRALIDLVLDGTDGATLAQRLMEHLPALEVTFTTGGTSAEVLCRAHGLGTVIWKPLGLGPLCERFGYATRRSGTTLRKVVRESFPKPALNVRKA